MVIKLSRLVDKYKNYVLIKLHVYFIKKNNVLQIFKVISFSKVLHIENRKIRHIENKLFALGKEKVFIILFLAHVFMIEKYTQTNYIKYLQLMEYKIARLCTMLRDHAI